MFNHMAKAHAVKCMKDIVSKEMKSKRIKVICILQNAWGDGSLPIVFKPNPYNKSASVMRKILGDCIFHFCNTTPVVTKTASGISPIDPEHFQKVLKRLNDYDIIVVCGKQAEKAVSMFESEIKELNKLICYFAHPAARNVSRHTILQYQNIINNHIEDLCTPKCDSCSNKATTKMSSDGRYLLLRTSSNKQNHTFCDTCAEEFLSEIEKIDPIEDTDWDDFE